MSALYLDCTTGISGDMTVAALLDAGADEQVLRDVLDGIDAEGFTYKISRVKKAELDCCDFDVILDGEHDNHDHDMEYLYGEEKTHGEHDHGGDDHHHGEAEHAGTDHHETGGHHHHHVHRGLSDVTAIIDATSATESAKALATKIFHILAESESKVHGCKIEDVHFHEVGAIDSIVDIIAAAVCFDNLNVSEVIIPRLCDGQGWVRTQHGVIPVPVPAVMNIAQMHKLPLSITDREGEFVTPTGAAFAAAVMTGTKLPEVLVPVRVGMGAGKREHSRPGILRAILF